MRYLFTLLFVLGSVCAAEGEFHKQLESIKNDEKAKAVLMEHVKWIAKWATADTKTARERVSQAAKDMVPFWGETTAELLKKRLNSMVGQNNGIPEWKGTTQKFIELKKHLIRMKELEIKALNPVKKPELTLADKMKKKYKEKNTSAFIATCEQLEKMRRKKKPDHKEYDEDINKLFRSYRWTFNIKIKRTIPIPAERMKDGRTDGIYVSGSLESRYFEQGSVIAYVLKEELPKDISRDTMVTVTGFFNESALLFTYDKHRKRLRKQQFVLYSADYLGASSESFMDDLKKKWYGKRPWQLDVD